ncbi:LptF/LptG family permease [Deltaproteobacteria bacterium TL4]
MFKILSKYIASEFGKFFILILVAFTLITLVGNLFEQLSGALQDWNHFKIYLKETALLLPTLFELTIPMTVLLATIATYSVLSRTSEIVAMRAAGMGFRQLTFPVLCVTLFIAIFSYVVQHYLFNWMNYRWNEETQTVSLPPLWKVGADQKIYYFGRRNMDESVESVAIFQWESAPYRIVKQTVIGKGVHHQEDWTFQQILNRVFTKDQLSLNEQSQWSVRSKLLPAVAFNEPASPHHQPLLALYQSIQKLQLEGHDVTKHWVEFYQKLTYPVTIFIMVLIGVALSATHGRMGSASESIAISCLIGILFWIMNQILLALGSAGVLEPFCATTLTNFLFFLLALGLFYRRKI